MPVSIKPHQTEPFVLYQSTLLNAYTEQVIHGFTGKPVSLGGQSQPAEGIRENRLMVCHHVGLNADRLTLPRQTHSNHIQINHSVEGNETDAIILTEPGLPAMVQVADCVPIILYAPAQHMGAVIHAGWRGTAQAITQKVAKTLIDQYHVPAEKLLAVIGPSIGGCCYEVDEAVATAVAQTIPEQSQALYQSLSQIGKPQIDLKQVNRLQLQALGIQEIEIIEACTRCLPEYLWSHRRGEAGRQVAFLQLK